LPKRRSSTIERPLDWKNVARITSDPTVFASRIVEQARPGSIILSHDNLKPDTVAAYEILTRSGQRILCDPFLDQNPGAATKSTGFDHVDLVVVSHAAFDHLGDTDKIAEKYGCPVVCGGEVKAWLMDRGIPAEQIPNVPALVVYDARLD